MRLFILSICSSFLLVTSPKESAAQQWLSVNVKDANGKTRTLADFDSSAAWVVVFLSPECPLCKNYTKTLRELHEAYAAQNIRIVGVIAGKAYSPDDIAAFTQKYRLPIPIVYDRKYKLAKATNATVTPEAFVLDRSGKLIYRGLIDNWAVKLGGTHRREVTETYVIDALEAYLSGTEVAITETEPMGCLIYAL